MFIYQPNQYSTDRVVWYGGESTQFHYEQERLDTNGSPQWKSVDVRTLGGGIPSSMSEMHAAMVDYYNHCQTMECERRQSMAD